MIAVKQEFTGCVGGAGRPAAKQAVGARARRNQPPGRRTRGISLGRFWVVSLLLGFSLGCAGDDTPMEGPNAAALEGESLALGMTTSPVEEQTSTLELGQSEQALSSTRAVGATCSNNLECGTQLCAGGRCVQWTGRSCSYAVDCIGKVCTPADSWRSKTCGVLDSCGNGIQDGKEIDVDCGGPECKPCADGKTCYLASDCWTGVCDMPDSYQSCILDSTRCSPKCGEPTCSDGRANGRETGRDCGGPDCRIRCKAGEMCLDGTDCKSGVCGQDLRCR